MSNIITINSGSKSQLLKDANKKSVYVTIHHVTGGLRIPVRVNKKELKLSLQGMTTVYNYIISGNVLTITMVKDY